jgi:hypothetical protein
MRSSIGIVVLAVVVSACLPPAGRLFRLTLTTVYGSRGQPVVLGDQTGLVTGLEQIDPTAAGFDGAQEEPMVKPDPSDATAILVGWVGGECDSDDAISFAPSASGDTLRIDLHVPPLPCGAAAIGHGIRIRLTKALDTTAIVTSYGR